MQGNSIALQCLGHLIVCFALSGCVPRIINLQTAIHSIGIKPQGQRPHLDILIYIETDNQRLVISSTRREGTRLQGVICQAAVSGLCSSNRQPTTPIHRACIKHQAKVLTSLYLWIDREKLTITSRMNFIKEERRDKASRLQVDKQTMHLPYKQLYIA